MYPQRNRLSVNAAQLIEERRVHERCVWGFGRSIAAVNMTENMQSWSLLFHCGSQFTTAAMMSFALGGIKDAIRRSMGDYTLPIVMDDLISRKV